jgi:hypothetical protein
MGVWRLRGMATYLDKALSAVSIKKEEMCHNLTLKETRNLGREFGA